MGVLGPNDVHILFEDRQPITDVLTNRLPTRHTPLWIGSIAVGMNKAVSK